MTKTLLGEIETDMLEYNTSIHVNHV